MPVITSHDSAHATDQATSLTDGLGHQVFGADGNLATPYPPAPPPPPPPWVTHYWLPQWGG